MMRSLKVVLSFVSAFVCLSTAVPFSHASGLMSRAERGNKELPADIMACGSIRSQWAISLADYHDWIIDPSGGTKAGWTVDLHPSDTRRSLAVWFMNNSGGFNKSQLIIKSPSLSARKFETINSIAVTFKSGVHSTLKIILRDADGRQFYSKNPVSTGYSDWVEFTGSSFSPDAINFLGIRHILEKVSELKPPQPPFSIDQIQMTLPVGTADGIVKVSELLIAGESAIGTSSGPLSPYTSWLKENCNQRVKGKPSLTITAPESIEPFTVNRSIPVTVSVNFGSTKTEAILNTWIDRFGSEPELLQNECISSSDSVSPSRKIAQVFKSPGLYAVTAKLSDLKGNLLAQASRKLLVWDPPGNTMQDNVSTFFGMMYLDRFAETRKRDLALMAKAGVRIIRFPFRWSEVQLQKKQFKWNFYDGIMKDLKDGGFIAQPMVFYTPKWAARNLLVDRFKNRPQWIVPREKEEMASFMGLAASRYKAQLVVWEVWNEPTEMQHWIGGDVDDYLAILKAADREIHRAAPNAKVLNAGIGIIDAQDYRFAPMIANQLDSIADGYAIHAYDGERQVAQSIAKAQKLVETKSKDKGVWLNETGYLVDPSDPAGELRRSAALTKMAVMARFKGAKNFTWFIFKNISSSANSPTDNFAVSAADDFVRPPILAYANVARWLAGATPISAVDVGRHIRGYEFSSETKGIIVTWMEDETKETDIKAPQRKGMHLKGIFDMFGGPVNRTRKNGVVRQGHAPLFFIYEQDKLTEKRVSGRA